MGLINLLQKLINKPIYQKTIISSSSEKKLVLPIWESELLGVPLCCVRDVIFRVWIVVLRGVGGKVGAVSVASGLPFHGTLC